MRLQNWGVLGIALMARSICLFTACVVLVQFVSIPVWSEERDVTITASSSAEGTSPQGVFDGDRFSTEPKSLWKGSSAAEWLQVTFATQRRIGAILQIQGDNADVLSDAPRNYAWQVSDDGHVWRTLRETVVRNERRAFRLHRLTEAVTTRHARLMINLSHGAAPTIREVEFHAETDATVAFPDWILAVSSMEDPRAIQAGMPFVQLARECEAWNDVPAQCIWHGDFDEAFLAIEPRPLCAFFSGSLQEWCQCSREPWRGVEAVLKSRRLPMWGACGGAQVLAILDETGVDQEWDCPRCRDPKQPKLPIYTHIGHLGPGPCGEYGNCIGEYGLHEIQVVALDPVFDGLGRTFEIHESHVGQIAHVPQGWVRIATKGDGGKTVNQCLRVADAPIYAAQFHMESFAETRETSKTIIGNFLKQAKAWSGSDGQAKPLSRPEPLEE